MAAKKTSAKAVAPAATSRIPAAVREAYWRDPTDLNALRVWADALTEAEDPRGEFIALSVLAERTDEQTARLGALFKKLGGKLVGPARPFLRTYTFGANGLVDGITTEAPNLIAGFELIAELNPRLSVTVTSLKKKQFHAAFAKLPLHRFAFVNLSWNGLTDDWFVAIAPALQGVKRLNLNFNNVTGAGLRRAAPYLESLEALALERSIQDDPLPGPQTVNGWVDALCDLPAFSRIHTLSLGEVAPDEAHARRLQKLPGLRSVLELENEADFSLELVDPVQTSSSPT